MMNHFGPAVGLRGQLGVVFHTLNLQKICVSYCEAIVSEIHTPRKHLRKLHKSVGKVKGVQKRTSTKPHPTKGVLREGRSVLSVFKPGEFYNYFGITATDFYEKIMTDELAYSISEPRHDGVAQKVERNTLSPDSRILLVLYFLKHNNYLLTARLFSVSKSYVRREIHHGIPRLLSTLHFIGWPRELKQHKALAIVGAIDCSPYFRDRIHPNSGGLYRGDHGKHALTVQLITSLTGEIYDVVVLLGHNNDSGAYRLTGVDSFLRLHGLKLAADNGYGDIHLVTPSDTNPLNHLLLAARSVVETPFAYTDTFGFASEKVHIKSLPLHGQGLMICFEITAMKCLEFPFRTSIEPLLEKLNGVLLQPQRPSDITFQSPRRNRRVAPDEDNDESVTIGFADHLSK